MNMQSVAAMGNDELVEATRELARRSSEVEAELLVHLGEIDERRLYLDRAFSSMFAFCTRELGFSEGAAYNRILVARAARKLPALIEAVRSGSVHLAGLRLLAPHLTDENHADILQRAAGRSKQEVGELVAALAPRPAMPAMLRKLPDQCGSVAPIAADIYRLHLTISRELRDEIREAQDLLRHRVPDGDLAKVFQIALNALVTQVKKERFAVGRKARGAAPECGPTESRPLATKSRHVPDAMKRAVYERDGGRCAFTDAHGRRCEETSALEIDHVDGFARTHRHELDDLRLLCRAHNQHAAETMYGRAFMQAARERAGPGVRPVQERNSGPMS